MSNKLRKRQRNGIGFIIGSIPLLLIGICLIDIYFENIPRTLTSLRLELIDFPLHIVDIQSDIHTTIVFGIILWIISLSLITTSVVFLIIGIKRKRLKHKK